MASFTTRVELHDAKSEDYDKLHEYMEKEGFNRKISGDKITYQLPTAEYNYLGEINTSDLLDKAESAAKKTNKTFEILVTQSAGRSWIGLTKLNKK